MRYSTYNAIPQYPKSKKHPYETLEKWAFPGSIYVRWLSNLEKWKNYQLIKYAVLQNNTICICFL